MTDREFNRHIEKIRPRLLSFASSFISVGAATPEDMVQDAVLKVWNQRQRVENIDAMMTVALRNVCLDYLRLRKNRSEDKIALAQCSNLSSSASNPQKALEYREQVRQVGRILQQLPPDQQLVLRLRDVMGYEFDEIARILDMAEGNARVLLCRARKAVREEMINTKRI